MHEANLHFDTIKVLKILVLTFTQGQFRDIDPDVNMLNSTKTITSNLPSHTLSRANQSNQTSFCVFLDS